jgi:hypothetical protein
MNARTNAVIIRVSGATALKVSWDNVYIISVLKKLQQPKRNRYRKNRSKQEVKVKNEVNLF